MDEPISSRKENGILFIVSAPAGTGKTTLVQMLIREFPHAMQSISTTTRQPRKGEINGICYHFVTHEQFQSKVDAGDFLEYVKLYGYFYGTSRKWVLEKLAEGKHVVLVIDTQGALALQEKLKETEIKHAVYIFVTPPSFAELKSRLQERGSEPIDKIEERLQVARLEMKAINAYDYLIVNDELNAAYQALKSIMIAEEHRILSK